MDRFKEEFLEKVGSKEVLKIIEILNRIDNAGQTAEVIYYALVSSA